jgi:hypothetical protein
LRTPRGVILCRRSGSRLNRCRVVASSRAVILEACWRVFRSIPFPPPMPRSIERFRSGLFRTGALPQAAFAGWTLYLTARLHQMKIRRLSTSTSCPVQASSGEAIRGRQREPAEVESVSGGVFAGGLLDTQCSGDSGVAGFQCNYPCCLGGRPCVSYSRQFAIGSGFRD